jgi:Amt family ammonium transporter
LQVPIQITAIAVIIAFAFSVTWLLAKLVDVTVGLRVTKEEETVGLDISQHGERAYGGLLR